MVSEHWLSKISDITTLVPHTSALCLAFHSTERSGRIHRAQASHAKGQELYAGHVKPMTYIIDIYYFLV